MNKLLVLAAASESGADAVSETEYISIMDSLTYSGLGFGIVFSILIVLMAFITVMSLILRAGKKTPKTEKAEKAPAPAPAPVKVEAPVVAPAPVAPVCSGEADMFVTVNGKKHAVSVEEKIPRFTVTVNGKAHGVDVESVEEE